MGGRLQCGLTIAGLTCVTAAWTFRAEPRKKSVLRIKALPALSLLRWNLRRMLPGAPINRSV